jgi:hypothetical protein
MFVLEIGDPIYQFLMTQQQFNTKYIFDTSERMLKRVISSLCYEGIFLRFYWIFYCFSGHISFIVDDGTGVMRLNREDKLNYILKLAILNDSRLEFYPCWFDNNNHVIIKSWLCSLIIN